MLPTRRNVTTGIRQDRYGFEAHIKVGRRQVSKRFPLTTDLDLMERWRQRTRDELSAAREFTTPAPPTSTLKKSLSGWCYVYFARSSSLVKIGVTEDPAARLRTLQTAHPNKLALLAAVPAHAALERAIHEKFAHLRQTGEWFALDDELIGFINKLAAGANPVALLW